MNAIKKMVIASAKEETMIMTNKSLEDNRIIVTEIQINGQNDGQNLTQLNDIKSKSFHINVMLEICILRNFTL